MNKKVLSLVMAGAMAAGSVMPAFASQNTTGTVVPVANGTEVYAGVILTDDDARIKVTVPTLFAFVVNGTVESSKSTEAISVAGGSLLLPNVLVEVDQESSKLPDSVDGNGKPDEGGKYSIQVRDDAVFQFENFSTRLGEEKTVADNGGKYTPREGLKVFIRGSIKNEGTPEERNYWTHVASSETTKDKKNFKNYNLEVNGITFDGYTTDGSNRMEMKNSIALAAPDLVVTERWQTGDSSKPAAWAEYANMDEDTKLANVGTVEPVTFNVSVGGERGQYKQVEESAKVGTIVWTVSADASMDGVWTAPANDYLDGETAKDKDGVDLTIDNTTDPDNIPLQQ